MIKKHKILMISYKNLKIIYFMHLIIIFLKKNLMCLLRKMIYRKNVRIKHIKINKFKKNVRRDKQNVNHNVKINTTKINVI